MFKIRPCAKMTLIHTNFEVVQYIEVRRKGTTHNRRA